MSNEQILVVEDELDLLRGLAINLTGESYRVFTASRGDEGLERAWRERPDLVLLDVMLPVMSGMDVCRELRRRGFDSPIIMLTARSEEIDRVLGFEIGADDYVTKPFGLRELLARVRTRLRRTSVSEKTADNKVGDLSIDFKRHEAIRNGLRIELTGKEASILRILAENRGEIVSRERLLDQVWGERIHVTPRTVDNHILRLRQKLETDPSNPRYIVSMYGEGYRLCC